MPYQPMRGFGDVRWPADAPEEWLGAFLTLWNELEAIQLPGGYKELENRLENFLIGEFLDQDKGQGGQWTLLGMFFEDGELMRPAEYFETFAA